MDIAAALRAFAAVFPAELPDKTMIATVVLVAHHRRALPVWCGAAAAFTVHVTLAVVAGRALRLLPATPVALATAALFAIGAVLLWRGTDEAEAVEAAGAAPPDGGPAEATTTRAAHQDGEPAEATTTRAALPDGEPAEATTTRAALLGSFGVVMVAEAGDLTQLATAGIAASSDAPVAVAVGALAALWLVAALAAGLGRRLVAWLPVRQLRRGAAAVFATLAVVTAVAAVT